MLLELHFYLPLAKGRGWEVMKRLPYVHVCVSACVGLLHFYINLNISFICDDIFTKFAENIYGCENMSVKKIVVILTQTIWLA